MGNGELELEIIKESTPWDIALELKGDIGKNVNNIRMSNYPEAVSNLRDMMKPYANHTLYVPEIKTNRDITKIQGSLEAYANSHNECVELRRKAKLLF